MRYKSFIASMISILLFCACTTVKSNLEKYPEISQSDFAILDQSNEYVMKISEEDKLIRLCTIPLDIKSKKLMDWAFVKGKDCMYSYSSANSDITVNLVRIDSMDYSIKEKKLKDYGIYSYCADDDHYYAAYAYTDRIDFVKYDTYLEEKKKYTHKTLDHMKMPVSMQIWNDYICVLTGIIPNGGEYGEISNHLLIMDKAFNEVKDVDLGFYEGAYNDSVIVGDQMYLTVRTKGFGEDGIAYPANEIHILDLNTLQISDRFIYLSEYFPEYVEYDPVHNNLIIRHNKERIGDCVFTIFSLTDGSETQIRFADYYPDEEPVLSAMDFIAEDVYYILTDRILLIYEPKTKKVNKYDLSDFSMNKPHTLIARSE